MLMAGDLPPQWAVLPIGAGSGNLAQVDLGIEVGGKGIAVIAAVAVQNIDVCRSRQRDASGIGAVGLRHTGIKAGAEQSREAGLLEFLAVLPLIE